MKGDRAWLILIGLLALSVVLSILPVRLAVMGRSADADGPPYTGTVVIGQSKPEPLRLGPGQIVVGEVPAQPPSFVDRAVIDELRALFRARAGGRTRVALTGPRGVGKTQTAAAFARQRIRDRYPVVAWISGESPGQLWAGLAELADRLGVADREGDSRRSAMQLRNYLEVFDKAAVLIVDNAVDPDTMRAVLPSTGRCEVVVISTDQGFADFGEMVKVPEFTRQESVAYLEKRTGLGDRAGAREVAKALGDLPVAVAQAPAVIKTQRLTYYRYLDKLHRLDLEAVLPRGAGSYPRSTEQALLLSITTAEGRDGSGLAGRLLLIIAVLGAEGVNRDLLHGLAAGMDGLAVGVDAKAIEDKVDQSLAVLVEVSVLSWLTEHTVAIHRLTARVVRERSLRDPTERTQSDLGVVIANLDGLLPDKITGTAKHDLAELFPHIEALWESLVNAHRHQQPLHCRGVAGPAADRVPIVMGTRLMNRAVRHWDLKANSQNSTYRSIAIATADHIYTVCNRVLEHDHAETRASRYNLARAYVSAGQFDEAVPLFEANLDVCENLLGCDHAETRASRDSLAHAHLAKRLDLAIKLFETNLDACERALGGDHSETRASRNSLAHAYVSAKRLYEAISLFETELAVCEHKLGPYHVDTLTIRNNLAYTYQNAGRLDLAIELYEPTLATCERVLDPEHQLIHIVRANLDAARKVSGRRSQKGQRPTRTERPAAAKRA